MKKCMILLTVMFLLTGCAAEETFETLGDVQLQTVMAPVQSAVYTLPEEAIVSVMEAEDTGTIYLCDGYTVTVQTLQSGDLEKTLRSATGFSKEDLTLLETQTEGTRRIQCVWAAAGEGEEQVGRLTLLDDGNYHYVLTCMADATQAHQLQPAWQALMDSFRLLSPEVTEYTGS